MFQDLRDQKMFTTSEDVLLPDSDQDNYIIVRKSLNSTPVTEFYLEHSHGVNTPIKFQ